MISDKSIQNVYVQCFEHEKLRVDTKVMKELLEEIAEYRNIRLKKPQDNEGFDFFERFINMLRK